MLIKFKDFNKYDELDWTKIDAIFFQAEDNNQKGYFTICKQQ